MSQSGSVGGSRAVARPGEPTAMDRFEVYVVDEHQAALAAMIDHIERAPGFAVVGSSSSVPAAVAEIAVLTPDVAVIDGFLDDRDGRDVCLELRQAAPDVGLVIVTAAVRTEWQPAELSEAGVAGIVLKQLRDFRLLEVVADAAIRQSGGAANR